MHPLAPQPPLPPRGEGEQTDRRRPLLSITGKAYRTCDGVSRRGFLQAGFLGLAGLSLADVLRLRAAQGTASKDTSVILVWKGGGPSHIDTWDPKPDAPAEYRGDFKPIKT